MYVLSNKDAKLIYKNQSSSFFITSPSTSIWFSFHFFFFLLTAEPVFGRLGERWLSELCTPLTVDPDSIENWDIQWKWLLLLNPCIKELYQAFNEGLNFHTVWFDTRSLTILSTTTGSSEETDSFPAIFGSASDDSYTREGIV